MSPGKVWYGGCLKSGMESVTGLTDSKNGKTESAANAATPSPIPSASAKLAELKRHLKENESQRTEINGYINQLNIQLHRWQLRLQTLNERNKQLTDQMAGRMWRADSQSAALSLFKPGQCSDYRSHGGLAQVHAIVTSSPHDCNNCSLASAAFGEDPDRGRSRRSPALNQSWLRPQQRRENVFKENDVHRSGGQSASRRSSRARAG